jgi:hypothetical protein
MQAGAAELSGYAGSPGSGGASPYLHRGLPAPGPRPVMSPLLTWATGDIAPRTRSGLVSRQVVEPDENSSGLQAIKVNPSNRFDPKAAMPCVAFLIVSS